MSRPAPEMSSPSSHWVKLIIPSQTRSTHRTAVRRRRQDESIPDKKSVSYFRPQRRIAEVYAATETIVSEGVATVAETCRFLEVNRTAFYA